MMIHDPKKAAALIVSGALPKAAEEDSESDETVDICRDIISAIKSGSADDLAFALKAFHSHLGMGDEASEEESEME